MPCGSTSTSTRFGCRVIHRRDSGLEPTVVVEEKDEPDECSGPRDPLDHAVAAALGSADDHRFRADHLDAVDVREAEEAGRVGIVWMRPERLVRRCDLDDVPCAHDGDAIAERERFGLIVRDVDRGRPELLEDPAEVVEEPIAQSSIERSEGLVQQEDARLGSQRASERNALPLATRQRPHCAPLEPNKAHQLEKLSGARFCRLRRVAAHPEPEREVAEDVAVRKERVVLEDEADPTPVRWDIREILSVEQDSTPIG